MAAQTFQARFLQQGESIDYTPGSAVGAGDVVVLNGVPLPAKLDIAANALGALETLGAFAVVKDASVFTAMDPVYWNATGDPVGGVVGTGAATSSAAGNSLMGFAILGALTGDATVNVKIAPEHRSVVPTIPVATVAATGTVQADAASVAASTFTVVTGADAAKGVKLPAASAGLYVEIKNNENAVLKVWPATGDSINAIAVNSNYTMAAFTSAIFRAQNATNWFTTPLVAS